MSRIPRRSVLGIGAGAIAAAAVSWQARADSYVEPYEQQLNALSLDQKIRQLFLQPVHGNRANASDPRNTELYGEATPSRVVRRHRFGGVILRPGKSGFAGARALLNHTNALQRAAQQGGGVALQVVWEGHLNGLVDAGVPITEFPEPMALGAHKGVRFHGWGYNDLQPEDAYALGVNTWFGPRADVSSNPDNPRLGTQAYGGSPEIVAESATVDYRGARLSALQLTALRMFPGAGDLTVGEDGLARLNQSREEWDAREGAVYRELAPGSDTIQVGNIVAPALDSSGTPASLSRTIIDEVLKQQCQFYGVVVTDSLADPALRALADDGELAVRALEAGAHQLYDSANPVAAIEAIHAAIRSGRLTADDIHARAKLILRAKRYLPSLSWLPNAWSLRSINSENNRDIAQQVARGGVTVVSNEGLLPIREGGLLVVGSQQALGEALAGKLPSGSSFTKVAVDPDDGEVAAVVSASSQATAVVVLTDDVAAHPTQRQLVEALVEAGRKVVAVAVGTPYDLGAYEATAKVATYTSRPLLAPGLAEVLTGAFSPKGKLPVAVSSYPIGTGVTW